MQVEYGLARSRAVVKNSAIAFQKIAFARQLRGYQLQLPKHGLIRGCGFVQRRKMFAWAEQNVRGRLRADVLEGKDFLVLIHELRRNFLIADFAEQAVSAHESLLPKMCRRAGP